VAITSDLRTAFVKRRAAATLAVGKRLARDLYAVYERGLSGVLGTLRVFYDINRRLQLRLEAGDSTGADLVYTVRIE
jgi:translocation and assembly module TamB